MDHLTLPAFGEVVAKRPGARPLAAFAALPLGGRDGGEAEANRPLHRQCEEA